LYDTLFPRYKTCQAFLLTGLKDVAGVGLTKKGKRKKDCLWVLTKAGAAKKHLGHSQIVKDKM